MSPQTSHADPARSARARDLARQMLASRVLARADLPATLEVSLGERYTELEAEVEVESEEQTSRSWLHRRMRSTQLRLEPSLVQAIERCSDGIILLEGEPGSGKTVSLHRVERSFAKRIRQAPECPLPLPLCVKLKYLTANERTPREQIFACILRALDPDAAVAQKLFDQGLRCGGWLLLLDGFDEIPGVLSAIEIDVDVRAYALAIHGLYADINQDPDCACRIVVATRHYHGPKGIWRSIFRLRPLSPERRMQFIRNFALTAPQVAVLVDHLATAPLEVQHWADNPLSLAMLCEVVENGELPPDNLYSLFERYLALRFSRDAGRLRELYNGSIAQLRRSAEEIGFVMSAEFGLGLAPSSEEIRTALERHGFSGNDLERTLAAIDGIDLVIRDECGGRIFTGFRHRRLQEYFATCVLLREPDRIAPETLLFDARWREATVVLLQQGEAAVLAPILERIEQTLTACRIPLNLPAVPEESENEFSLESKQPLKIEWPDKLYHLLSLMQAGFAYRSDIPEDIQYGALSLMSHIYRSGIRMDKQYVLEVIGALPPIGIELFALAAFESKSELLQDAAFKQISRIGEPSLATRCRVSRLLIRMARTGKIVEDQLATRARIRRTNSKKLEALFEMASGAATFDRTIRVALIFTFILLLLIFAATSGTFTLTSLIAGVCLLLPQLAALFIRDLSNRVVLVTRLLLDVMTLMPLMIVCGLMARRLGLETVGLLVLPGIWFYAYVWAFFMLVAVYYQLGVGRRTWPFILPRLFVELLRLPGAFTRLVIPLTLIACAIWVLEPSEPEMPDFLVLVLVVVMGGFSVAVLFAFGRQTYLHVRDWVVDRSQRSGRRGFTGPTLRKALAGLRTTSARIRLLRETLSERFGSLTRDRATYDDLSAFVVALENHALAIEKTDSEGLAVLFAARIRFAPEYRTTCLSEHQRWCLEHCAHAYSVDAMHDMIDLLTRLLESVEHVVGGPRQ